MARYPLNAELRFPTGPIVLNQRFWLYERGTTTQVDVFPDAFSTIPLTQPLRTDSAGRLRGYADYEGLTNRYDAVVIDSAGATLFTYPIEGFSAGVTWLTPTNAELKSNWTQDPFKIFGFGPFQYAKTSEGMVICRGLIGGGTITAGTDLYVFPAGYRPGADVICLAISGTDAFQDFHLHTDGLIELGGAASSSAYISFDGVHFRAEN